MKLPLQYPRSFTLLVLLAFLLVVLPLAGGLFNTASILDKLVDEARRSVATTVTVTRGARQLTDGVDALQRIAVQYYVLEDPGLRQPLISAHRQLQDSIALLQHEPLDPEQRRRLDDFAQAETRLYRQLGPRRPGEGDRLVGLAPRFDDLHAMAVGMIAEANRVIDRQTALLQNTADAARRTLILQGISMVPLSLFLALIFSWLINRPVRQLGGAIRRLGEHDMTPGQAINGPRDLVQLGEQIDWLRLRLIELEEQKTQFLRHVSHELKTPLAALREGVELLADRVGGELTPQQEEITQIMRGNARELQRMIEDLIGYSRVHQQPEPVAPESFSLEKLLELVAGKQNLVIRSKELQIEVRARGVWVFGDEKKLEAVFGNLLSNAIRFSPKGGRIEMRASVEGMMATIQICDQGPGVPKEDRASIFDPFFKGRAQPSGSVRGSGLGLAIVKEYIEAHNGQVDLVDNPPWGACFRIVLAGAQEPTTRLEQ